MSRSGRAGAPSTSRSRRGLAAVAAASVALGAAVAVNVVTAAPATAAAAEIYPVPASGAWAVSGKGFGHGRGMSQWGSQGAARLGLSARQILAFYYPGTAHTTIPSAPIRVLITADEGADMVIGARAGLAVRDVSSNRLYVLPAGPPRWRAVADATGMHIEAPNRNGWARWTAPDGLGTWGGPLRLGVGEASVLTLYVGTTPIGYRGKLTATRTGTTSIATVNTLPLDAYLWSVVPAESPPSWLAAALQAQAVAARTYAAYNRRSNASARWDICDTTACQVYPGASSEAASTTAAVRATPNQIRTWNGLPILSEFSSSNGGWTVASSVPYQVSKADPYDAAGGTNPHSRWEAAVLATDLQARYPQIGQPRALRVLTRDGHGAWGGRITSMVIDGSAGSVELSATTARLALKSTWWIPRPTVVGPATAPGGSVVALSGTARAGAAVEVWFKRPDEVSYVKRRDLLANGAGRWTTSYVAAVDLQYYAVSYGLGSSIKLTRVTG